MTKPAASNRIIGVDYLRLFSALAVFLFHANIHTQCTYGFLTDYLSEGAIFMDLFLLISGFSIYYSSKKRDLSKLSEVGTFYKKRLLGIFPAYLAICIVFLFTGVETWDQKILVLPMDLLMLQSEVFGTFPTLHHGGTWYISCMLFCYLIAPFLVEQVKQMKRKTKIILMVLFCFIIMYIPVVVKLMGYSTVYYNIVHRCLQFAVGVLLAGLVSENEKPMTKGKCIGAVAGSVVLWVLMVVGITHVKKLGWVYTDTDFIAMPLFTGIVYLAARIPFSSKFHQAITSSKLFRYLNGACLEFFLGQFFCFNLTKKLIEKYPVHEDNLIKLTVSFVLCVVFMIVSRELFSKMAARLFAKKAVKSA